MKRAFVDLDGTLLDSTLRHVITLKKALQQADIFDIDLCDYMKFKSDGYSTEEYIHKKISVDGATGEKICKYWRDHIEDYEVVVLDKWYEDAISFAQALKYANYRVCILTARRNSNYARQFISNSNIMRFVDEIDVVDPQFACLQKTNILFNKKCEFNIMVGDTENDYYSAVDAGIDNYMLNRGFRSRKFWEQKGIASYQSLKDIREMILDEQKRVG